MAKVATLGDIAIVHNSGDMQPAVLAYHSEIIVGIELIAFSRRIMGGSRICK